MKTKSKVLKCLILLFIIITVIIACDTLIIKVKESVDASRVVTTCTEVGNDNVGYITLPGDNWVLYDSEVLNDSYDEVLTYHNDTGIVQVVRYKTMASEDEFLGSYDEIAITLTEKYGQEPVCRYFTDENDNILGYMYVDSDGDLSSNGFMWNSETEGVAFYVLCEFKVTGDIEATADCVQNIIQSHSYWLR